MKRIIGMLMAVCFCFGMCMQTNVSYAENWKQIDSNDYGRVEIDVDSIKIVGKETYQVWERRFDADGMLQGKSLNEYKVQKEKTGLYSGLSRILYYTQNGKLHKWEGATFHPIYGNSNILAYLNQNFGDRSIQASNWTWIYSSNIIRYSIDTSSIMKYNGVYGAWIEEYDPYCMEGIEKYEYMRKEYKEDKQGRLWVRYRYYLEPGRMKTDPWEWELAKDNKMYPTAEKEFAFIKAYLGEK